MAEKLKVLLLTGRVSFEHDFRKINDMLRTLIESTGRFEVRITEEVRGLTDETLEDYDVLLFNYDGKIRSDGPTQLFGQSSLDAILRFVHKGKGAVFYHTSVWLGSEWPTEYRKLLGAYCSMAAGSHKNPKSDAMVQMQDLEHPITRGLAKNWMAVEDDFFGGVCFEPECRVQVLATVSDDLQDFIAPEGFADQYLPQNPDIEKIEMLPGINGMMPVVWVNSYGQGRTFTTTLGHSDGTIKRVNFLTMLVRALEWAATGTVTLNPPDRSGEKRIRPWPFYVPEDYE